MSGPGPSSSAAGTRERADPAWVARLTGAPIARVRAVLKEAHEDRDFEEAIAEAHASSGRSFYAQVLAPFELYALVRILEPRHIVELGVSSGVSSSYFLKALQRNGQGTLHSIDFPTFQKGEVFNENEDSPVALPPGMSSGWAIPLSVKGGWDLRVGRGRELLPRLLQEIDRVDLFFHDDEHTFENATWELTLVAPKVPPGGVFLADNTDWLGGAFEKFAEGLGTTAARRQGTDLAGFSRPVPGRDRRTGKG